jgi:hypothetical protein
MTSVSDRFRTAWAHHGAPGHNPELIPSHLAAVCAQVLPVDAAGLSVLSDGLRVPIGASSVAAAHAERLQFTTGTGPCLDAYHHRERVASNITQMQTRWPVFAAELLASTPYGCVVSEPLRLWGHAMGALDLYSTSHELPPSLDWGDVTAVTAQITDALNLTPNTTGAWGVDGPAWLNTPSARQRIQMWVAIGMLTIDSDLSSASALAVLRAHAYAHDTTIDALAAGLVAHHIPTSDVLPVA